MAAPYAWMTRWQEMPDDPILYQPLWGGGADDAGDTVSDRPGDDGLEEDDDA